MADNIRVHLMISLDVIDRCIRNFDIPFCSVLEPHGLHQLDMLRRDIEMFPDLLHAVKLSHRLFNKTPWAIIENLKYVKMSVLISFFLFSIFKLSNILAATTEYI